MKEIQRRSFLALLGAAVAVPQLPRVADVAMPLPPVEAAVVKSAPIAQVRRWFITYVELRGNAPSTVWLTEVLIAADETVKRPSAKIKFKDVETCRMEWHVGYLHTIDGPIACHDAPVTAELDVSLALASRLHKDLCDGVFDTVEFEEAA